MICAQPDCIDPSSGCRGKAQLERGRPSGIGKVILVKMDGVVDTRTIGIQRSKSPGPVRSSDGSGWRVHRPAVTFVPRGVDDSLAADVSTQVPSAENGPELRQTVAGRQIHDLVRPDGDAEKDR
jgi:hypothetical protein